MRTAPKSLTAEEAENVNTRPRTMWALSVGGWLLFRGEDPPMIHPYQLRTTPARWLPGIVLFGRHETAEMVAQALRDMPCGRIRVVSLVEVRAYRVVVSVRSHGLFCMDWILRGPDNPVGL
jgi:hypothetical protein